MSRPRILVVGLGDTGLLVAVRAAEFADVVVVTTKPEWRSGQELGMRLASPEAWRRDYRLPFSRVRHLDPVRIVHGAVTSLDVERQVAEVTGEDGDLAHEPYDLLVIATGVSNGFWRAGDVVGVRELDRPFEEAHRTLSGAATIAIVGGGAAAVGSAAQIAERWPDKDVALYFPGETALTQHHRAVWPRVDAQLRALGVSVHPGHRAVEPGAEDLRRIAPGTITWSTGQPPTTADAILHCIGRASPNTGWVPESLLDADGYVRVDATLRSETQPTIYAIGDVAATDPLRSSARNFAHDILVANLRAALKGGAPKHFRPPSRRWGSVLGLRPNGLTVYDRRGRGFRVPRWVAQRVLQGFVVRRIFYRGVRRSVDHT